MIQAGTRGPWEWKFQPRWDWKEWVVGGRWQQLRYAPFGVEYWASFNFLCFSVYVGLQQDREPGTEEWNTYLMNHHAEPYYD